LSIILSRDNYLDNDVAYLLGLIVMRGTLHIEGDIKRLIIQFPYKFLEVKSIYGNKTEKKEALIRLSLEDIRNRIQELLEVDVQTKKYEHEIQLVAVFTRNTVSWRNLRNLLSDRTGYLEFEIPPVIFDAPDDIQKEFLRGIADAASNPSKADAYLDGSQRVVIEFQHGNWMLPVQVCRLLQEKQGIKVSHILWGHPNIRTPGMGGKGWAKEHRMRIFANDFAPIGYNFAYKQKMFEDLVKLNIKRKLAISTSYCNPKIKKIRAGKPKHKYEKDKALPKVLRRHFDAYFQICKQLGCNQGIPCKQTEMFEEIDED